MHSKAGESDHMEYLLQQQHSRHHHHHHTTSSTSGSSSSLLHNWPFSGPHSLAQCLSFFILFFFFCLSFIIIISICCYKIRNKKYEKIIYI
jgi:hypothetical protein